MLNSPPLSRFRTCMMKLKLNYVIDLYNQVPDFECLELVISP